MAAKDVVGRDGEQLAAEYLESLGLVVVARNWRCRHGELDIIATDGRDLAVICEVKTRSGVRFGSGADAVDVSKRRKIRRLTALWLADHDIRTSVVVRFDVISVLWERGETPLITHFESAF